MASQIEFQPDPYIVRPGDTLSSIAKTRLGSAIKWHELLEANRDVLGESLALKPGMTLRLPKVGSPPPESDLQPWKPR